MQARNRTRGSRSQEPRASWRGGPLGPWIRQLRDKSADVPQVMREALGDDLGSRVVDTVQRAIFSSAGGAQVNLAGFPIRYTATVELREPHRLADSALVRRVCEYVLRLCGWMGLEGDGRTGRAGQGAALSVGHLGRLLEVSDRTLTRENVVLRATGLMDIWQPPQTSKAPKGDHSGHCFQMFRWAGGMPAPLRAILTAWQNRGRSTGRVQPPSVAAQAPQAAQAPAAAYDTRQGVPDDVRALMQARGLAPPTLRRP
jgi:hypothetical protein